MSGSWKQKIYHYNCKEEERREITYMFEKNISNGSSDILLVEILADISLESNLTVTMAALNVPLLLIYSEKIVEGILKDLCIIMFIIVLFIRLKVENNINVHQ